MVFRIIAGVGFLVLAVLVVLIGGSIGRSFGGLALVLVLLVLGVALIVTAYLQPNLANKAIRLVARYYPPKVRSCLLNQSRARCICSGLYWGQKSSIT